MHTALSVDNDYLGSGKILKRSVRKYGKDNHKKEILIIVDSKEELIDAEKKFITEKEVADPLCMNLRLGGSGGGGWSSEQQRNNAEKSNARQKILNERDAKWRAKKSAKISQAMKLAYEKGERVCPLPNWKGRKHTESSKKKMVVAAKKRLAENNNGSTGRYWYYNDDTKENIKCLPENKPEGFTRGRKMQYTNIKEVKKHE